MKKQIKIKEKSLKVCLTASCGCYKKRATTDRGLTIWQINRFLRKTGYRVCRRFAPVHKPNYSGPDELVLKRVNKNFKEIPFYIARFRTNYIRRYDLRSHGMVSIQWWTKAINKRLPFGGRT